MSLRRGAVVMLTAQWGRYGMQLASLVVLARLLPPGDFGLVAMATAVSGLAAVLGDFGLSLAALQSPNLTQAQRSNLFWLNGALGTGTAALVAAASPAIAGIYGDERLIPICLLLAVVFALNGFAVQFSVEINRAGRFGTLGLSEFSAQAVGLVAAVSLAVGGAGYWALVLQQVAVAAALLCILVVAARWRPSRPSRGNGSAALVRFGRDTFAVQLANYVTSNLDTVLVGRLFGATVLGLYNRAFLLVMIPIQQIVAPLTRVLLPRLATLTDDDEFNALLVKLQRMVAYALLAPLSLLAAVATPMLVVLLGPSWSGAGVLLQILALGAAFQSAGFVYYWAFLARRRTGDLFRSELWGRLVMVALMVVVAPLGPAWIAATVALGQALIWLAAVARYGSRAQVRSRGLLAVSARPVVVALVAFAAATVAGSMAAAATPLLLLLLQVSVWVVVAAASGALSAAVRADLAGVLAAVSRRGSRSATV